VDALVDWLRTGDDPDLHRIQIRERARVWGLPAQDVLRTALHATRAGLLTLSWNTVCPHCRGVRDENATLAELAARSRCEVCRVDFATDTPESVEVTFHVHPSVRNVPDQVYCSAEPRRRTTSGSSAPCRRVARSRSIPGSPPGRYPFWREHDGGWYLDVGDGGTATVAWASYPRGTVVMASLGATLELVNDTATAGTFRIEQATWSDHALRAGHLLSFQEFRDLFSEDYIGAGVRLGVGEQTRLFTDVVGSTAFYAARGDPAAFVEIKKHFDEVFAIVGDHRGAVVKTIGDAVMASF
jgi:hypothetical protein